MQSRGMRAVGNSRTDRSANCPNFQSGKGYPSPQPNFHYYATIPSPNMCRLHRSVSLNPIMWHSPTNKLRSFPKR